MSWQQFSVAVPAGLAQQAADLFEASGALTVTMLDAADELLVEPEPGATPLWRQVRVVALFAADCDSTAVLRRMQALPGAGQLQMRVEPLADRDWSTTWRDSFRPMCFGERLWVCPVGDPAPTPAAVVLHLDPGNAFGTGTHATTAMCLEWLDRHPPLDFTVLDYGCGSGILAIAAALLGAARVHAVDIDPQALQATRENARLNGVLERLDVCQPAGLAPRPADVVLANILANPLQELAVDLSAHLRPGGAIIMTGIIAGQEDAVMAAYQPWVDFATPQRRAEWVLLHGRKRLPEAAFRDAR